MISNKKASGMFDLLVIFIFIIGVTLLAGIGLFIFNTFNGALQDVDAVPNSVKTEVSGYNTTLNGVVDGGIILWFTLLWLGSLVTSLFLDNSPIFFVIFLLLSVFSMALLIPFANIQSDLSESALSLGYQHLPMTMFIFNNFLLFMGAFVASVGLTLYIKGRVAQ